VVTGGNRGIGLEICRQLASNGVTVVLTARDDKRGAEAVSILGSLGLSNVVFHQLDISNPSSAVRLADFVKEKFGKLDILVWTCGFAFLYCNLCVVVQTELEIKMRAINGCLISDFSFALLACVGFVLRSTMQQLLGRQEVRSTTQKPFGKRLVNQ
jgi:NAD(P)-dependent dehydrogenase (short-subunit alcohol dehydrogenase family)